MNKQELIMELKRCIDIFVTADGKNFFEHGKLAAYRNAVHLAKKLDEPEKVVVPQFVAEWFEENKDELSSGIFGLIARTWGNRISDHTEIQEWANDSRNRASETLVKMKLFGYEVDKEPVYKAKSKLAEMENWGNDGEDYFNSTYDRSENQIWLEDKKFADAKTISEWAELGVTEEIAIFEEVDE